MGNDTYALMKDLSAPIYQWETLGRSTLGVSCVAWKNEEAFKISKASCFMYFGI
jgi:hypothetical protein